MFNKNLLSMIKTFVLAREIGDVLKPIIKKAYDKVKGKKCKCKNLPDIIKNNIGKNHPDLKIKITKDPNANIKIQVDNFSITLCIDEKHLKDKNIDSIIKLIDSLINYYKKQ